MSTGQNNARPRPASAPVISLDDGRERDYLFGAIPTVFVLRYVPAVAGSIVFHVFLIIVMIVVGLFTSGPTNEKREVGQESTDLNAEAVTEEKKDPLLTSDIDPAAVEFDTDINYAVERKADVSVPGEVRPNEAVGITDGDKNAPPTNLPAPGGFGGIGQGGALDNIAGGISSNAIGDAGGYGP